VPGFTGEKGCPTGHIDDRREKWRESARDQFERLHPWKECGDCAFIPSAPEAAWWHRTHSLAT
jgi:hypothetical protein